MKTGKSLSSSVAIGVAWMLAMRMGLRILGLISTVILARLLTPEDFGIVAIAMSIYALLHLIKEFGFDTAIIQMEAPEKRHYDTAWTFNLIFGVSLSIIFGLSASMIADLYETPELEELIWAIASLFIISGFESVGTLDFRKNLTFDKEFRLKIIPKLIGVPSTLILAYYLRDYWSLTIGTIITQTSILVLGYWMHSYRPKFNLSAARELFDFSKWLMINNIIYFANVRSPELFIGKLLTPQAAGLYTVSNEIGMMVTTEISAAVSRASYPGYAKVAKKEGELKSLYINVISSSSLILFPIAFGFYSVSDLVVPIFLGNQWLSTIPIMELVAIAGLLMALNSNAGYVFMAIGKPKLTTIIGSIRASIFLPLLILLINHSGIYGAALAVLYTTVIMFFITSYTVVKCLPLTFPELVSTFYRPLIASSVMTLVIAIIDCGHMLSTSDLLYCLFIKVVLGGIVYVSVIYLLWWITGKDIGLESKVLFALKYKLLKIKKAI